MKKVLSIILIAVLTMSLLASCGKKAETSNSAEPTKAAEPTKSEPAKKVTLTVTAPMADENRVNIMNKTIEILNKKDPNIEVKFIPVGENYGQTLKLAFSSGEGQDLVYVDDLNQQMLQTGNYLMDITDDVNNNKWIDKQVKGAVEFNNLRTPGKYYSVPFLMAPVVVFYNKDIFTKLNVTPPKTLDEFNTILAKAKEAGYIPMEVGGMQNMNLMWSIYHMVFANASAEDVNKWYYCQGTTDAVKNAFTKAFAQIDEWADKGYFRKGVISIDYNNTPALYGQGKTAVVVDGDWNLANFENTKVPTGVFVFPSNNSGSTTIVNATDGAWAVNSKLDPSKKEAAMKFINNFMDPEVIKLWYEGGMTPSVIFDSAAAQVSPLKQELNTVVSNTNMGFFLDNAVPGLFDVMTKETQLLVLQKSTPEKCWEQVNTEYEKLKANNKK